MGPRPFAGRLPFLLEGVFDHQLHGLVPGHALGVNRLIEDGVGDAAEVPLQDDQPHEGVAAEEALVDHHLFAIDGPALDEHARGEQRPQHSGVAVGVCKLEEMARHRLVDGEVVQRAEIVLAEERLHLLGGPVFRQGGHCVEGLLAHVERARRIAVSQGDAPAKLRHDDDLDGVGRDGHQVFFPNEGGGQLERLLGGFHDRVGVGHLLISQLEAGPNDRLLVGFRRVGGKLGQGVFLLVHALGDVVHLVAYFTKPLLGPPADVGPGEGGLEGEGQLLVEEFGPQAKIAGSPGKQLRLEPLLVRLDGDPGRLHGLVEPFPLAGGQLAQVGLHHVVEDAQHPAILLDRRLGVDLGHPLRIERRADLAKQPRELLEPVGHVGQPLGARGEVAGHQAVDRIAGQPRVPQRVPGPGLQPLQRPEPRAKLVCEQRVIHLIRPGELGRVDFGQPVEKLAAERGLPGPRRRADLVELAVEAVVAERRGRHGRQGWRLVDETLAEFLKPLVHRGFQSCCWGGDDHGQRQDHICGKHYLPFGCLRAFGVDHGPAACGDGSARAARYAWSNSNSTSTSKGTWGRSCQGSPVSFSRRSRNGRCPGGCST